jgi:hypothetical protein
MSTAFNHIRNVVTYQDETFTDDAEADAYLTKVYKSPYVLADVV